jgi:hypothetical protein
VPAPRLQLVSGSLEEVVPAQDVSFSFGLERLGVGRGTLLLVVGLVHGLMADRSSLGLSCRTTLQMGCRSLALWLCFLVLQNVQALRY